MSIKNGINNRILAYSVILLSLMLVFSYIEAVLPISLGGIGVKIGLSNIITIIGLKTLDIKKTLFINILRLIILGVLFGNILRFVISISGFTLSFVVMSLIICKLKFSIVTTSIFGAVLHNIGQVLAVYAITRTTTVLALIPYYVIIGIFTGLITGIITKYIYNNLSLITIE